ncbi:UDP-N-acetylglucosamine 2-epimerase (non-hydrolyzing) [Bacteroidetes/Chlorobi group bacterium Naka2016]|jgi:UDP-N-acetylglucosamine 2-epimerase (non-hydrolysing)|nr:MAG: UDP-N-acetylglucosamine 2-epimerase (non-hydrolyzing) [Bacteroidetes/Chlorobi group bacterium Naka2016]
MKKIKIISVVGARPNFMKVAPIHRELIKQEDKVNHLICHTGQHYDYEMSKVFFEDLGLPSPDFYLGVGSGTHGEQTGKIMIEFEKVCFQVQPDLVIVVGDVNSTIAATLTATKMGIKTAHIEAGLRSFDRTMPEEINRIATDSICDFLFVTEESGIRNLLREGHSQEQIFFVGNTMIDSLVFILPKIEASTIIKTLKIEGKDFALMTLHRPSNVDDKNQLEQIIEVIEYICKRLILVLPLHPRTKKNIDKFGFTTRLNAIQNLVLTEPLGYLDFVKLMKNSKFVITDSGGIQEETTYLGIPCITMRTTTERPITCEIGTNMLVIPEKNNLIKAVDFVLERKNKNYQIPPLWDGKTANRIVKILLEKLF